MGLATKMTDISDPSIPLLLFLSIASCLSHLRSLLLGSLDLIRSRPTPPPPPSPSSYNSLGAPLAALAESVNACPSFTYVGESNTYCVICMGDVCNGEKSRRLPCGHVFHSMCIITWFGEMSLFCPLCRDGVVAEDRRVEAERRMEADMVAWLSR